MTGCKKGGGLPAGNAARKTDGGVPAEDKFLERLLEQDQFTFPPETGKPVPAVANELFELLSDVEGGINEALSLASALLALQRGASTLHCELIAEITARLRTAKERVQEGQGIVVG